MENNEAFYTKAIYTALRIGFIAFILYWSYLIVRPFILVIIWSIILAITAYPLFKRLAKRLGGRRKLAALIFVLAGLVLLIFPTVLMFNSAVDSIKNISEKLDSGTLTIQPPKERVAHWPVIGKSVYDAWKLASENMEAAVTKFEPQIKKLAPKVFSTANHLIVTLLLFLLSIILAGVFLVYAQQSKKAAQSVFDTLIGEQGKNFTGLSVATIKSVVMGILGIAVTQSLLAGLGMWAIDMPGGGLWAILVLIVAIVQLPPILVMGPIAIYSFTFVDTTPAVIFSVWSIFVSISDAFLKPLFLGRGVDVPMPAVLMGAIGGVILYGMIGLFVGAVVLAITYKTVDALLVRDILDQSLTGQEGRPLKETPASSEGATGP